MTSLPFVPAQPQPALAKNAAAPKQFSRLLDALVVLEAEGSCHVAELARRVGLAPDRMRELLVAFMVAGAETLAGDAPLTITFGTADGELGTGEEDDEAFETADVVYLSGGTGRQRLLGQLGARPVMVRDVARALLAARLLLDDDSLPAEQRAAVGSLAVKLSLAMQASVSAPAESVATVLLAAVRERRVVRFRYLHPWSGEAHTVEVEPYEVRRRRDRLVLDAGAGDGLVTYDLGGISELVVLDPEGAFPAPELPDRGARSAAAAVVLRVPAYSGEEAWLESGWGAVVVDRVGKDVDVRIDLDGEVGDPDVAHRLGVLLLQLGPDVRVVSPGSLRGAAAAVAQHVLRRHKAADAG